MSDPIQYAEYLATQQINERIARRQADRIPRPSRPRGRHALARHLHSLADRLDA